MFTIEKFLETCLVGADKFYGANDKIVAWPTLLVANANFQLIRQSLCRLVEETLIPYVRRNNVAHGWSNIYGYYFWHKYTFPVNPR